MSWKNRTFIQLKDSQEIWRGGITRFRQRFNYVSEGMPSSEFCHKKQVFELGKHKATEHKKVIPSVPYIIGDICYVTSLVPKTEEELAEQNKNSLANLKNTGKSFINKQFRGIISEGFTYEGKVYQIDDSSTTNMQAVQLKFLKGETNAHGGYWRTEDNKKVNMSDEEVQTFFDHAFNYKMALVRKLHADKTRIDNARTEKTVNAVIDEYKVDEHAV